MSSAARNRTNAAWLRSQLEDLRFALSVRDMPCKEMRDGLARILSGEPWRAVFDERLAALRRGEYP